MSVNTNINVPYSEFLDPNTKRPSREWLQWLLNPQFITFNLNAILGVQSGGTGMGVYTAGAMIYANTTLTLSQIPIAPVGNVMISDGSIPQWGKLNLSNSVGGILSLTYGGTNATNATDARANLDAAKRAANSDITSLSAITGAVDTPTYVSLNSSATAPAYQEGRMFYDPVEKTLAYYNDVSGITLNVCQEEVIRVFNDTGAIIPNGAIVYISGANGGFPKVSIAQANVAATSQATIGVCTNQINIGSYGYITTSGTVHDLNTNVDSEGHTITNGDILYLSASVAGGYTNVAPIQPNYDIQVGYVIFKNATTGKVYVRVDPRPWYPNLEARNTASAIALLTTPTVFVATSAPTQQGITYSTSTGIATIGVNGSYSISIMLNAQPPSANKQVYFYAEADTGAGWLPVRYSAKLLEMANAANNQLNISSSNYYKAGDKLRFYIWGSASGVTLNSVDLPGTTANTVTVPAFRFLMAG